MLIKNFNLLVLFGILFLEIIGTLAENNESSSDIQIRKKRVINPAGAQNTLIPITQAGYIVSIERRGSRHCVGSILSPRVIITVAHCVEDVVTHYQVLAGSHKLGSGSRHNVTHKVLHENYNPRTFDDDVALLVVYPLIPEGPNSHRIQVYEGVLQPRHTALIVGWGCSLSSGNYQNFLQSIRVPVLRYDRCTAIYRRMFHITEKNICTLDLIENKRCGVGDFGAPLVVDNQLIGMYIWSGTILGEINKPDVFIYLHNVVYREWIETNLRLITHHINSGSH